MKYTLKNWWFIVDYYLARTVMIIIYSPVILVLLLRVLYILISDAMPKKKLKKGVASWKI